MSDKQFSRAEIEERIAEFGKVPHDDTAAILRQLLAEVSAKREIIDHLNDDLNEQAGQLAEARRERDQYFKARESWRLKYERSIGAYASCREMAVKGIPDVVNAHEFLKGLPGLTDALIRDLKEMVYALRPPGDAAEESDISSLDTPHKVAARRRGPRGAPLGGGAFFCEWRYEEQAERWRTSHGDCFDQDEVPPDIGEDCAPFCPGCGRRVKVVEG